MKITPKVSLSIVVVLWLGWVLYYQFSKHQEKIEYPILYELYECLDNKNSNISKNQILGNKMMTKEDFFFLDSIARAYGCLDRMTTEDRMDTIFYELDRFHNWNSGWSTLASEIEKERVQRRLLEKYSGNQLSTGDNPFKEFFGRPKSAATDNELTIVNQSNQDVIVVLVNVKADEAIGDYYIRAYDEFTVNHIPNGEFYLKQFSGRNWCPEATLLGGLLKGGFLSDLSFSSSKNESTMTFLQEGATYTTYKLTLETSDIQGSQFQDESINEKSFFATE